MQPFSDFCSSTITIIMMINATMTPTPIVMSAMLVIIITADVAVASGDEPGARIRLGDFFSQPRGEAGLEYHSRHLDGADQIDIRHINITYIACMPDKEHPVINHGVF